MYTNKVKELPVQYAAGPAGVREFCAATIPHLTEEVRAQLQQQLERSHDLQWGEVQLDTRAAIEQQDQGDCSGLVTVTVTQTDTGRSASGWGQERSSSSSSNTDSWSSWRRPTWKGPQACKPTDIVLISSVPIHDVDSWQRGDVVHSLGLVLQLKRCDEDSLVAAAEIQVFAHHGSQMWEHMGLGPNTGSCEHPPRWYMAVISSAAASIRTWDALHAQYLAAKATPAAQGTGITVTAQTAIAPSGMLRHVVRPSERMLRGMQSRVCPAVEEYCRKCGLNASQQRAVECIAAAADATAGYGSLQEASCVQLIQGPPGTGKTSTITRALSVLLGMGVSVLVCAPMNVAVQEVAVRFMQLLQRNAGSGMYGSACGTALGDIALLAAEDQVVEGGELEAIWSHGRAQRLHQALGAAHGLRALAARLARLLSTPSCLYEDYVKQQQQQQQEIAGQGGNRRQEQQLQPHQWFQAEVVSLCGLLSHMATAVAKDLPSSCVSRQCTTALQDMAMHSLPATVSAVQAASSQTLQAVYTHLSKPATSATVNDRETQLPESAHQLLSTFLAAVRASQRAAAALPSLPGTRNDSAEKAVFALHSVILRHAKVVFCTVATSGRTMLAKARSGERPQRAWGTAAGDEDVRPGFDACIIDEAAHLVEAETCITPNAFPQLPLLALVGDHKQLPATVTSQLASERGYKRSMFERLQQCGVSLHMLNTQYRMHPHISIFPRNTFYGGQLHDDTSVHSQDRGAHVLSLPLFQQLGPYHIIHAPRGQEQLCSKTASKLNRFEAVAVSSLVKDLLKQHHASAKAATGLSIGIISPYAAQVALLQEQLQSQLRAASTSAPASNVQLEIKSVDGFQGREMDVIIISTVRSNAAGRVGFLADMRRLNVAVTRGRHAVWLVVNKDTLSADLGWANLLGDAHQRGVLLADASASVLAAACKRMDQWLAEEAELLSPNNDLFKNTLWKVVFSREFITDILALAKPQRAQVIQRLLLLAQGKRPAAYPSGALQYNQTSPQFKDLVHVQHMVDMRLVWMVDVERSLCRQVLKVYRLVTDQLVLATVRRVEAALAVYTPEYLSRCGKVHRAIDQKTVVPYTWPKDTRFVWVKNRPLGLGNTGADNQELALEHAAVEQSLLLMKFFPLDAQSAYLLAASAPDAHIDLMFSLNEQEMLILEYPGTKFVQGRSGTGKTTVIVALLLLMEHASTEVGLGAQLAPPPAISHVFSSTATHDDHACRSAQASSSSSSSTASRPVEEVMQGTRVRQLLLTLSPKLCAAMRADLARKAATMRLAQCKEHPTGQANGEEHMDPYLGQQLLDEEAVAKLTRGLPKALSKVCDDQCPLVLPLDQLLWMLDASMPVSFARSRQLGQHRSLLGTVNEQLQGQAAVMGDEDGYMDEDGESWGAACAALSQLG